MEQRKVIRRVAADVPHGAASALQRAAEQLQRVLAAEVVFASEVDRDGVIHCVGVAPSDRAPIAPARIEEFPAHAAIMDEARRQRFARSYSFAETDTLVSVPVTIGDEFRALLTAVVPEVPSASFMRMLDEWALLVGECVDGELAHRRLDMRGEAVQQLRAVVDLMLKLTSDAVVGCDLDGRITQWNFGAEQLYGWRAEEVMGEVMPMVSARHRAAAVRDIRDTAVAGPMAPLDGLRHRTATGQTVRLAAISIPVLDSDGDVCGLVAVMQDQTPAVHGTRTAPRGVSEAALARLAAPVTAVSGFVQLLDRHDVLNDPVVRASALRSLAARCREIMEIGEELRLVTRLLDGEFSLHMSAESPEAMLRRAAERALGAEAARVTIEAADETQLVVDPECLEGTVIGVLRGLLRCHSEDSAIRICVRPEDDGVAIVMSASPGGELSMAEHPESSLGIHLARMFADAHGGSLGVRSETDLTEIRLVVPAQAAS